MKNYVITSMDDILYNFVFDDGKLMGIHAYEKERESLLGNIYVGRVQNIAKNIDAAFVEISKDLVCYYSLSDNPNHIFLNKKNTDKLCIGDLILVQLEKEAVKTKQPTVSSDIAIAGTYCVINYDHKGEINISKKIKDANFKNCIRGKLGEFAEEEYSIVLRTAAYEKEAEALTEVSALTGVMKDIILKSKCRPGLTCLYEKEELWQVDLREHKLTPSDTITTDDEVIFDKLVEFGFKDNARKYEDALLPLYKLYSLEKHLADATNKRVWLKSGAYLVIEYTEALTVIDVNTGKFEAGKDKEKTFLKINLEAADEIIRQLRLRNISGMVIIDFINMSEAENKVILCDHIKDLVKQEEIKTSFVEMTKLDLVELTRKKVTRPLHEIINKQ